MRQLVIVLGLVACERADDVVEVAVEMPAATLEAQRLNVDEIGPKVVRHAGVAAVKVTPLEDPRFTVPRQQVTAFEDSPPPAPVVLTDAGRWFLGLSAGERKTVREICRAGREDPCFGMLPMPRNSRPTKMQALLSELGNASMTTKSTCTTTAASAIRGSCVTRRWSSRSTTRWCSSKPVRRSSRFTPASR
jgi:hypothetical protein